ncbi:MBL fold metallo-hydrolase [Desulfoscipio gibsoniae]|uniref:Zn-dependent hydrolase, glyoxylase n=1 Tax=Desulfoscipio gibsoniae DSM 7213 TaxID=767817 RepID=R4KHU5_9FIRM|nr:MBL fold metallo-hydrolase [Desulfoscipio gibsoniae]AGL00075.1 Zn-dependent hydrolase, glyoxylase [Desulfoscipio gibsoniae DSM 7213]
MLIKLTEKLYFIAGERKGMFPFCHGLLVNADIKVLIDSSFGRSRLEPIQAFGNVDVIINTHYHPDHTYGNRLFPNAKIWAHHLDAPALFSREVFLTYTGLNRIENRISLEDQFPGRFAKRHVARVLSDGELLDFGGISLQVVHLPGHTPGHIGFYQSDEGILFSSDIDLSPFGPWYGNARSDLEDFIVSIRKVANFNPRVLVTSHTGIIVDRIPERVKVYEEIIEKRDERILNALSAEKSMTELVNMKLISKRFSEPEEIARFFEQVMLEKHLERLISQGKVVSKANGYYKVCF